MAESKVEFLPGEHWKLIKSFEGKTRFHYAVSNFARIICFKKTIYDGYLSRISENSGGCLEVGISTRYNRKSSHYCLKIHRALAECFLPAPLKNQNIAIHIDYNKKNNSITNLKWVTRKEMNAHLFNRPDVKKKLKKTIESLPEEEWRLIKSLEKFNPRKHYAVSNAGRVMSFERDMKFGRLLKPMLNCGYLSINASKKVNKKGIAKPLYIHKVIAECFLPSPLPHQKVVIHKDSNKQNNNPSNLTWISHREFFRNHTTHYKIKPKTSKFRIFLNEEFRKIESLESYGFSFHYAISNYGRLVSYLEGIEKDGRLLKGNLAKGGYKILKRRITNILGKTKHYSFFYHCLMAECFLPPPQPEQTNVLHKDHNKINNVPSNLFWASKEKLFSHMNHSPLVIARRQNPPKKPDKGAKLTSTQVKVIKRLILNSGKKINNKIIARKFNISVDHLINIKYGKVWAEIIP